MRNKLAVLALAAALLISSQSTYAHEWYTGQRNPVTGSSCCGKADCVKLPPNSLRFKDGNYIFKYPLDNKWYSIPADQALPSRDSHTHVCVWGRSRREAGPSLCIFIGGAT